MFLFLFFLRFSINAVTPDTLATNSYYSFRRRCSFECRQLLVSNFSWVHEWHTVQQARTKIYAMGLIFKRDFPMALEVFSCVSISAYLRNVLTYIWGISLWRLYMGFSGVSICWECLGTLPWRKERVSKSRPVHTEHATCQIKGTGFPTGERQLGRTRVVRRRILWRERYICMYKGKVYLYV